MEGSKSVGTVETSVTKGSRGTHFGGIDRGVIPIRFRGGKDGRVGKPGCMISGTMCGAGKLSLDRSVRLGSPAGNGIRPGNVVAGLTGGTEVRD